MCALHLRAQLGDQPLAGFGEQLGEGVGGDALDEGGAGDDANDHRQHASVSCR